MVRDGAVVGEALNSNLAVAGQITEAVEERREDVGLVVGRHVLEDCAHALEAHAGIDAGLRKRCECAVGGAVELDEDVVPQFPPTVAVAGQKTVAAVTEALARAVVDDLGIGAAGARVAHGPEVLVGAESHDLGLRSAC